VTQEFRKFLKAQRNEIQDAWTHGSYVGSDVYITGQLNAEALGKVRVLEWLLSQVDYETVVETLGDARD
jgi:hypothetical protein